MLRGAMKKWLRMKQMDTHSDQLTRSHYPGPNESGKSFQRPLRLPVIKIGNSPSQLEELCITGSDLLQTTDQPANITRHASPSRINCIVPRQHALLRGAFRTHRKAWLASPADLPFTMNHRKPAALAFQERRDGVKFISKNAAVPCRQLQQSPRPGANHPELFANGEKSRFGLSRWNLKSDPAVSGADPGEFAHIICGNLPRHVLQTCKGADQIKLPVAEAFQIVLFVQDEFHIPYSVQKSSATLDHRC